MQEEYQRFWEVDNMTEAWLKIVTDTKETLAETELDASIILKDIPVGAGNALEIGAGVGRLMKVVSRTFGTVYGVDMSKSMVKFSEEYLKDFPTCKVILGDGLKLPIGSGLFDFVYSYICFQHMPDLATVRSNLREAYRVLKPGGYVRIQTIKGRPCNPRNATGPSFFGGMHGEYFETATEFSETVQAAGFMIDSVTLRMKHPTDIWITGIK